MFELKLVDTDIIQVSRQFFLDSLDFRHDIDLERHRLTIKVPGYTGWIVRNGHFKIDRG